MKIDDLLNHMWKTYTGLNPHILEVLDLIKSKENTEILNDHIALRTFNPVSYTHLTLPTTPYV